MTNGKLHPAAAFSATHTQSVPVWKLKTGSKQRMMDGEDFSNKTSKTKTSLRKYSRFKFYPNFSKGIMFPESVMLNTCEENNHQSEFHEHITGFSVLLLTMLDFIVPISCCHHTVNNQRPQRAHPAASRIHILTTSSPSQKLFEI